MLTSLLRGPVGLALTLLPALACARGGSPAEGNKGERGTEAGPRKADFTLTAEEFTRAFLTDSKAADKKYKGKGVAIIGEVKSVMNGLVGRLTIVTLRGAKKNEQDAMESYVTFALLPAFTETGLTLSRKQKVKITGEYGGHSEIMGALNLTLVYGSLEQLSKPEYVVSVSAADLVREVARDAKAAEAKYAGKDLIVTGEIEELVPIRPKDLILPYVRLKGDGKRSVEIYMSGVNLDSLKKGRTVRLRGEWQAQEAPHDRVRLFAGLIVKAK